MVHTASMCAPGDMAPQSSEVARRRWALLASALRNKALPDVTGEKVSVRRFGGFGLFATEQVLVEGHEAVQYVIDSMICLVFRCAAPPLVGV